MENENKKNIPWFHRLCAFAVACAVCASFCVLAFTVPRFRARADGTAWAAIGAYVATQITYAALLDITSQYVSNNPEAAAIRGAEIAYAFMLVNSANPAITVTSSNSKYYGGYTYYNGNSNSGVYFGSGYINDDARSARISVSTNTAEFPDSPASIVMNFKADVSNPREYRVFSGLVRGWSGTFFCAGYSPYVSEGILTSGDSTTVNGDPVVASGAAAPLFVGSTTGTPSLSVSTCGASFYSGSIPDVNSYLHSLPLTGDPETDFEIIHDDLEDDFPDDLPLYWVDPFEEPTEPTTETTEDYSQETTESGDDVQPFTLPPEWLETYTFPLETFPTIPFTDVDTPTFDLSGQTEGINFWFVFAKKIFDSNEGLKNFLLALLGIAVAGALLWRLGSHGGDKE